MHKWKAPGPDSLLVELLKIDEPPSPSFSNVSMPFLSKCVMEGKSRSNGKTLPSRCSTRSRADPTAITTGGSHFSSTQAKSF